MTLGMIVAALLARDTASARAQAATERRALGIVVIGSYADERLRLMQLVGDTSLGSPFRSVSTLNGRVHDSTRAHSLGWRLSSPELLFTQNSELPYSLNDGALWAGRGANASILAGAVADWGRARLFLLPELTYSENRFYPLVDPTYALNPAILPARDTFSSPWHQGPQSIDLPLRFGAIPFWRLFPGQSSLVIDAGRNVAVGASTENEWWGPGIRNALILSNNAPGFPHAFARPAHPVTTRWGTFDARWLAGWLTESFFFDANSTNATRSISMAGLSWQPPRTTLVLGAARSVFAPVRSQGAAMTHVLDFLADVGHPNARPMSDSTMTPGRDQLLSLFFRWVQPNDRFEFYGEWGRAEFPVSLRDFLVQPNHTQAYTLGLQWLGEPLRWDARLRAQGEVSFLEQSTTFRTRPIGSWYTSRAVEQGYTNQGQVLGAAIGPGSSSQFVALDLVAPRWQIGPYLTRIRWLEDAHSQQPYVYDALGEHGLCEHDVSLLHGVRAAGDTRFGQLQLDYSTGWRLNVFFENPGPCFFPRPGFPARDVRNKSFSLRFTPAAF